MKTKIECQYHKFLVIYNASERDKKVNKIVQNNESVEYISANFAKINSA